MKYMDKPIDNSPPTPLCKQRGVTHVQRPVASPQNELHNKLKEPQSGEIFIEERTPINPAPLFEKLLFRNELHKRPVIKDNL